MDLDRLAELARAEERAVASGRWHELLAIQDEQRELLDALPNPAPAEARPFLEEALARAGATQNALVGALAETKGKIERLGTGRRTVGAYGIRSTSELDATA